VTKSELFEEIRSMLSDAQRDLGITNPQTYEDSDLILLVRSALRQIQALGVTTTAAMALDGTLNPEPTNQMGVLLALKTASTLLRGDMISRVVSGEFGVLFSMGSDTIDTKTAAITFRHVADGFDEDFRTLLTIVLSDIIDTLDPFGGPLAPGDFN
jgi:hypothetical protein